MYLRVEYGIINILNAIYFTHFVLIVAPLNEEVA